MSFWEKYKGYTFLWVTRSDNAKIKIYWIKDFGSYTLGHTIFNTIIEMGYGDSRCHNTWQPYSYDSVVEIAKHEMGHAIGYGHVDSETHIMYPYGSTKYETDIDETDVLPDGWYKAYPICTKNSIAEYSFEVTSDEPLDIRVVHSYEDYKAFSNGKAYGHFSECKGEKETNYKKICTITKNNYLVLKNPANLFGNPASFSVKIKELRGWVSGS